jgi:glycosyltransferase involved in cell wall biosynthesis
VTLGDPNRRTGGYRYHRMIAEAAADHRAEIRFASLAAIPWPLPALAGGRALRAAADGADAILLDSIAAGFVAPWVARTTKPVVAVVHQPPGGIGGGRIRRMVERPLDGLAYRSAMGAIVAAESLVDDLLAVGVSPDRIAVVPPGCDMPNANGPPLDLRHDRAVSILCVANWSPIKGILELVEAFATLPDAAATLWLIGDTHEDRRYAMHVGRRILEPDLVDRIIVRGSVPAEEVARYYRSADVFAMPSFVDAYGTAWAEALAAGLPVVGWSAANLPRLTQHGREALMAEPGDVAGLASALRAITSDTALRERLAAGARRRAETLPTWRDSAERCFAAIRELIRR